MFIVVMFFYEVICPFWYDELGPGNNSVKPMGVPQIASFCIHNAKYMKMPRIQKDQKPVQRWTPSANAILVT